MSVQSWAGASDRQSRHVLIDFSCWPSGAAPGSERASNSLNRGRACGLRTFGAPWRLLVGAEVRASCNYLPDGAEACRKGLNGVLGEKVASATLSGPFLDLRVAFENGMVFEIFACGQARDFVVYALRDDERVVRVSLDSTLGVIVSERAR
jgi:hypothetical protein